MSGFKNKQTNIQNPHLFAEVGAESNMLIN
jgi:hypothetical protein